jgi:hypothetical protein
MITLVKTFLPCEGIQYAFVTEIFSDAIRKASHGKTVFINQFCKSGPTVELCAGKLIWTRGEDFSVSSQFDVVILENPSPGMIAKFLTIDTNCDLTVINPLFDEFEEYDNLMLLKRFY